VNISSTVNTPLPSQNSSGEDESDILSSDNDSTCSSVENNYSKNIPSPSNEDKVIQVTGETCKDSDQGSCSSGLISLKKQKLQNGRTHKEDPPRQKNTRSKKLDGRAASSNVATGEQPHKSPSSSSESDDDFLVPAGISSENINGGSVAEESKHSSALDATSNLSKKQPNRHLEAALVNIENHKDRVKSCPVGREEQVRMGNIKKQKSNLKNLLDIVLAVPEITSENELRILTNKNSNNNALTTAVSDKAMKEARFLGSSLITPIEKSPISHMGKFSSLHLIDLQS